MSERILALDLGTKCGWAVMARTDALFSGTWDLSEKENNECRWAKFIGVLRDQQPDTVFYEQVASHKGTRAAHVYGGLKAIMELYCFDSTIPCLGVSVGTIKKHATGKGNANKTMMIVAATKKWPDIDIEDDNQADALWLLDYATRLAQ